MHLIHNNVRDSSEVCVALQSSEQNACGAVQQPGGRCLENWREERNSSSLQGAEIMANVRYPHLGFLYM